MTTNWKCLNCGFTINFARETECSFCGESRDQAFACEGPPWRCPNCGRGNAADLTRCTGCDEPNPSNPPPGPMPVFFWATVAFVVAALVVGAAWALL